MRYAIISNAAPERVERYLPSNYFVEGQDNGLVVVSGEDNLGWTLDGYVLPRLASGLIFGREVSVEETRT
jgi:hypothetical protein